MEELSGVTANPVNYERYLYDEMLLRNHINKYHWYADNFMWDEWSKLLSEDTEFEVASAGRIYSGKAETLERCRHGLESRYQACQHVIVNLRFEFESDESVTGFGNIIFSGVPDKSRPGNCYLSGGRYNWEFVKRENRWLTRRTRIEFVWESNDAATSNFFGTPEQSS